MIRIKEHLTSPKNSKIKNLILLQKPRERREQGLFVLEGLKEIERAFGAGYQFSTIFWCPEMYPESELQKIISENSVVFTISRDLFEKISYRGNTGGLVALASQRKHELKTIPSSAAPFYIVLESVEKPGNLGAILRTADAAGVDALIVCDPQTDIYNPNVIRSSIGCLFSVPVAKASSEDVIQMLKSKEINIYCTALTASVPYQSIDYTKPTAIVMGTEATGLTDKWLSASNQNIIIPMGGIADSLNVSTSAAIVVFEAKRQRGF
jgi:TrmH family RNA methyltransferase